MKVKITGQAYLRSNPQIKVGKPNTEIIDTKTNRIFAGVTRLGEVAPIYRAFWNDLNPASREIVKVVHLEKLS